MVHICKHTSIFNDSDIWIFLYFKRITFLGKNYMDELMDSQTESHSGMYSVLSLDLNLGFKFEFDF